MFLSVDEVDEQGRICSLVWFDDTDLTSALEELDARFLAGDGAPTAEVLRLGADLFAHMNARDWDAYRDADRPCLRRGRPS